ncbi:hypothetical protein O6H91_03G091900 [Diphasiastrum complanatum]|uniref:Uncharacterized protein n=1 Tax=Diphasiastrum complanatum TaxID=34168 RepID=A0ACC2E940_DIPCM|nr:hypothetical protein O6H91_03G091900 [Diphasiastrum complanatum]
MENNHTGLLYEFLIQLGVENNNEHLQYVIEISVFVTLICACIVLGHLLEETRWINESITALILGCCTGFVVLITTGWTSSHILEFNEELFFIYLLPPIIFNAGFQVKKKQFFQNFAAIMLYGIVGVFISFAIISAGCAFMFPKLNIGNLEMRDYLALGTIFSATDSVCTLQVTAEYPKSRFTLWCFVL